MRPKFTRVLSIGADDDLKTHMERLSDDADDARHYIAEAIQRNLETTAMPGDAVNLPAHYARFKIEPIRFIEENKLPFLPGNVIKYTCRFDAKDGIQDLKKAIRCLEMMVGQLEGDPDWWKRKVAA